MARPTDYNDEVLEQAKEYLMYFVEPDSRPDNFNQVVPTVVGLCRHINRGSTTVYNWEKDDDKDSFRDILLEVKEMQHLNLVNGGLAGGFNPAVTKMMLTKHGYSDKQEIDHSSADGTMSPTGKSLDDFYSDSESD